MTDALATLPPEDAEISSDERTMAMLGHALSFVEGGILGPALLYFIERERSAFSAFHSLQSLLWGVGALAVVGPLVIATILASIAVPILGTVAGVGAILAAVFVYLGFEVIASVRAWRGEWYRLPIVGAIAYRAHHPEG